MLFRLGVKEEPEEFYDYEEQLEAFGRGLQDKLTRMIVVKGVRRIGKSSLVRVGLRLYQARLYAVVDARSLPVVSTEALFDALEESLSALLRRASGARGAIAEALSRIEGVSVAGVNVRIAKRSPRTLAGLVEALDEAAERAGEPVVLVLDEAQELGVLPGIPRLLAHIYDYRKNIKLVLAGSEVGVLDRLLGKNRPGSPLYGRPGLEIAMERLSREKAIDFLEKGFQELDVSWPRRYVEEAVESLDGIPGWLTAYGYHAYTLRDHREALRRTIEEGAAITWGEVERFLSNRGPARLRYLTILRCLSARPMTWSELKRCLEAGIGRVLNKAQYTRYLRELRDYGFIEKAGEEYMLADPLLRYALRRHG